MSQRFIKNIVFRVLAVALISLPLSYFAHLSDQEIKRTTASFSHQELSDFVTAPLVESTGEAFLIIFVLGILFVTLMEAITFGFRWIYERFTRTIDI